MRKFSILVVMLAVVTASFATKASAGPSFGAGLHYLYAMGDIDTNDPDLSKNSFGVIGSLQFPLGLIKAEADVEYIFDFLGTGEGMWEPQLYGLIGGLIYGGAGIGWGYVDGEWFDNPFYALRAGVDLPVGKLHLDVNANYRFLSTKALEGADEEDLDSVTFGAVVRFDL